MDTSTYDTPINFPSHAIKDDGKKKVVFCIPTITKPYQVCLDSLVASAKLIEAAGWEAGVVYQIGCPYVSAARSMMLRKALDAKATHIVFIDHDLSWERDALLRLLEAPGDVVAGTYRFKGDPEEYMGALLPDLQGYPQVLEVSDDLHLIKAHSIPAGFLKITRAGVNRFIAAYPELCYGDRCSPGIDLFNHGAWDGVWYGEDYAFARRWREKCGDIWIIPDLNITHWRAEVPYHGNFHEYLLRQPGGSESDNPDPPREAINLRKEAA